MRYDKKRMLTGSVLVGIGIFVSLIYYGVEYYPVRLSYIATLDSESRWALNQLAEEGAFVSSSDFVAAASRRAGSDPTLRDIAKLRYIAEQKNSLLRSICAFCALLVTVGTSYIAVALMCPTDFVRAGLVGVIVGTVAGGLVGGLSLWVQEYYLSAGIAELIWDNNYHLPDETGEETIMDFVNDVNDARPKSEFEHAGPPLVLGILAGLVLGGISGAFLGPNPDRRYVDTKDFRRRSHSSD